MDDIKKAKIYGVIAVIFFVLLYVLPLSIMIYDNGRSGAMIFYLIFILYSVFLICFIIFTILAIYMYFKHRRKIAPVKHAVKVLYERYAKGEITKEELKKMKKEIED